MDNPVNTSLGLSMSDRSRKYARATKSSGQREGQSSMKALLVAVSVASGVLQGGKSGNNAATKDPLTTDTLKTLVENLPQSHIRLQCSHITVLSQKLEAAEADKKRLLLQIAELQKKNSELDRLFVELNEKNIKQEQELLEQQLISSSLEVALAASKDMFSKSVIKHGAMLDLWRSHAEGWKVKFAEAVGLPSDSLQQPDPFPPNFRGRGGE